MKLVAILAAALLMGCAATSNITPMGRNTFLMTKQAATGFPGLGNMKAEVLTEANAHCVQLKKTMEVVSTSESRPPFILGNYPRVEVQFTCL